MRPTEYIVTATCEDDRVVVIGIYNEKRKATRALRTAGCSGRYSEVQLEKLNGKSVASVEMQHNTNGDV